MNIRPVLCVGALAALFGSTAAIADIVTVTYDFTVSDFTPIGFCPGCEAPQDPVSGSITATFDRSIPQRTFINVDAVDLTIRETSFTADSVLFVYVPGPNEGIQFMSEPSLIGGVDAFNTYILNPLGRPQLDFFEYAWATISRPAGYISTTGVVETEIVPIPAAAWLFGSALGLLGWMRRRAGK